MAAEITMSTVVLVVAVMLLLSGAGAGAAPQIGMPNCDTSCGGVEVPYPFGIGPDATCYLPGFNLTCDRSRDTPRLLLGTGAGADEILVDYISIGDASFLKVFHTVGKLDAAKTSAPLLGGALSWPDGPYILPTTGTGNELVLTGCNVQATLIKNGNVTVSGCLSFCPEQGEEEEEPLPDVGEECPGIGCCRAPTVAGHDAVSYGMKLDGFGSHAAVDRERVPVRAFIAVAGWFDYWLSKSPRPSMDVFAVPVYLHWEMGASSSKPQRCSSSSNAGCRSNHSICVNATRGYRCQCAHGYQGNPYIPDGCKADACDDMVCYGECIQDMDGKPVCQCGLGTQGNAMVSGGCVRPVLGVSDKGKCRMMSCGGVDVPYPFGIQDMSPSDCYHEGFNLTCDTTHDPPQLILGDGTIRVTEIHVENATMHTIYTGDPIVNASYYNNELTNFELIGMSSQAGHPVHYSLATSNELILTGCNTHATLHGDPDIVSGCASFCPSNFTATDAYSKVRGSLPRRRGGGGKGKGKYCHGMGCCQAPISQSTNGGVPRILDFGWLFAQSVFEDSTPPPTFVFIAMEGWFDRLGFSGKLGAYQQPPPGEIKNIPIVLQWEVSSAKHNCTTSSNICKSKHSYCKQSRKRGYTCHCKEGYPGNPYDDHDGGCKGDRHKPVVIGISIGVGLASAAGLIVSILIGRSISKKVKQQRALMLKQKFFEQNRGQLLQQLVSQRADIAEKMIIPLEELEKATHNFDEDHVLGRGGHGTLYKGMLSDLHVVAIKKPKKVLQREIDEFINEVAILSQINHRNVVKLYGCCLETEVPMLVYEFISNGTLYEHLHTDEPRSLSWNDRLRIATETAKSLAYLHSTASIPIIHRDVKSANILLDDTLTAKVADFGASRYIAVDKSGLTTMVQGTIGYLDPMYFYTGRLTEKSDVYSYGVMLVELLTRKKPFQYLSPEGEGLVAHFVTLCTKGNLSDILDPQVIDEGDKEIDEAIALAVACIKLKGEDRPTMRLVELTLEGLRPSKKHNLHDVGVNKLDKNGIRINSRSIRGGSGSETSTRQYSMEAELTMSSRYPR